MDTVFVLDEVKSRDGGMTTFDETFRRLKHDPDALNNQLVELLQTQINANLKDEIVHYRRIQALFPIISILFKDQTKVEIFVQVRTNSERSQEPIHGVSTIIFDHEKKYCYRFFFYFLFQVCEIEHLLIHCRSPSIFQYLLSFVRSWAQRTGLYGQVYGYLGGYSWAILCAHICQSFLSPIASLSSIEHFSIDNFFSLVHKFFSTYAHFPWSAQSLHLYSKPSKPIIQSQKSSAHNRGSMRIMLPSPPFNNTARSTTNSTRDLIVQGFQRVAELLNQVNEKVDVLKQILELNNDFPNHQIKSLIQLTLSSEDEQDLDHWVGWMKSRLAHFLNDCDDECHLSFQTQNTIERRSTSTEVSYSIGFQLDEQTLIQQRNFNHYLTKFLDQFNLCPNRKETMKISYRLVSVHDWKLERMQPKAQRVRK